MKKICLSVVGMFLLLFASFAQSPRDTAGYKPRKLTFDEANLVSSYYRQDGNNSAVTGGDRYRETYRYQFDPGCEVH